MEKFIEERYLNEIIAQINRAIFCINQINQFFLNRQNEDVFRELEHFLYHVGAISLILWNDREKNRCEYLRDKLNIQNSILEDRTLRNHLTHFDERLGKWASNSRGHNFIDQNIGDIDRLVAGVGQTDFIRNYNPRTHTYLFLEKNLIFKYTLKKYKKFII